MAQRRRVIALLINNAGLRDDYQGNLRRGVEQACIDRDLDLWVFAGRTDWKASEGAQLRVLQFLSEQRVDGIVLAGGCFATAHAVEDLISEIRRACNVPMCTVGYTYPGVPSVMIDNRSGAEELAEHLVVDHGRRCIACIAGPRGHEESEERLRGIRHALSRHGLTLGDDAVSHGDFMALSGTEAAENFLARGLSFDALVCANDDMARGALEALAARGVRCPDDVVVTGFDDARTARITRPALTTARQPIARLGRLAVARLASAWRGRGTAARVSLATSMVVRESCGCSPAHPRSTAKLRGSERRPATGVVARLLSPVIEDAPRRRRWAKALCDALDAGRSGSIASLPQTLNALLGETSHPLVPTRELDYVVRSLRELASDEIPPSEVERSFREASALLVDETARRGAAAAQQREALLEELRISGEQLATTLTLEAVAAALHARLPRFGLRNVLVALDSVEPAGRLVPLFVRVDGAHTERFEPSYPRELLLPVESLQTRKRVSLTVLALTFQRERLGVVVLDLRPGCEESTLLREQIGGAIKTVRMHEESLRQERLRAQAQEEKRATTERLRSLHVVAGGVAHDLNNALGPTLALPETILNELQAQPSFSLPQGVKEDLKSIRSAGERAAAIIRDLSMLGRPAAAPATAFDVRRLLRDEEAALLALCGDESRARLRIRCAGQPLLVRAAKANLMRALSNLVVNALDAIDGDGVITIRAFLHAGTTRAEAVGPGAHVVIEVQDTGCGIPDERLSRVFEPFFTARNRPGTTGTGLGLAIVQRIVEEAGGQLRVASRVGRGTTFSLYLPAVNDSQSSISNHPPAATAGVGRILVVDDEALQRRVAQRILTQLGYEVVTAASGEEALERYVPSDRPGGFEVVVMDVLMPGMDGMAAVERIRARHAGQAVVMVSGWAPEEVCKAPLPEGVVWLSKPYAIGDFAATVKAVLAESRQRAATKVATVTGEHEKPPIPHPERLR